MVTLLVQENRCWLERRLHSSTLHGARKFNEFLFPVIILNKFGSSLDSSARAASVMLLNYYVIIYPYKINKRHSRTPLFINVISVDSLHK